jgi:hypothetical protein
MLEHPHAPMGIRIGRTKTRCTTRVEGKTSVIATFSAWTSKERGARIKTLGTLPR